MDQASAGNRGPEEDLERTLVDGIRPLERFRSASIYSTYSLSVHLPQPSLLSLLLSTFPCLQRVVHISKSTVEVTLIEGQASTVKRHQCGSDVLGRKTLHLARQGI